MSAISKISARKIAIVGLSEGTWPLIKRNLSDSQSAPAADAGGQQKSTAPASTSALSMSRTLELPIDRSHCRKRATIP